MTKITCVIVDDEPFARKGLQKYVEKIDFLELIATCEDPIELNNLLSRQTPDLLFLDINMPHMTGVEFLKSINNPPKVIFTTAYEKYAIDGFDLDILDFLLKPISFDRFLKACNRARSFFSSEQNSEDHFFVKADGIIEKVLIKEVLLLESMQNYVVVHTDKKKLITHITLKAAVGYLPTKDFIQPHKSYYVAMDKIDSIDGGRIRVGDRQIPISKHLKAEVLERILNNRLMKK